MLYCLAKKKNPAEMTKVIKYNHNLQVFLSRIKLTVNSYPSKKILPFCKEFNPKWG